MTTNAALDNYVDFSKENRIYADFRVGRRVSPQNWVVGLLLADTAALVFSGVVPVFAGYKLGFYSGETLRQCLPAIIFGTCIFWFMARVIGVYEDRRILEVTQGLRRVVTALLTIFALLLMISVATKTTQSYSRLWFFVWMALAILSVLTFRVISLRKLHKRLIAGDFVYKALSISISSDPLAESHIRKGSNDLVKVVYERRFETSESLASVTQLITQFDVDQVYIAVQWKEVPDVMGQIAYLRQFAAQVFVVALGQDEFAQLAGVSSYGNDIALRAVDRPIDAWGLWFKRVQDVTIASLLLVAFAPLMLLVALAIKLESDGPVLFRQRRVGFNGSTFELLKFRSMYVEQADLHGARQTIRNDPRVSRVGRIIRRLSLDELPQLFNVLAGPMSVVGPRPHAEMTSYQGRSLESLADFYTARHRVKPGITGWAQINGCRGELNSAEKVRQRVDLDIWYIENWSTRLDLGIIVRTGLMMLFDRAAY